MLFHPAVIAILLASGLGVAMLLAAAPFAAQVIRRWDAGSGSELQLVLERRTYLFSTLLAFVFAAQLLGLLLFVFNADAMAVMFVGAMCAVGTLNVNSWGFPALGAQVALFFLAAVWLAINHLDNQAPDYPLVRLKYALFLAFGPLLAGSFALQLAYFQGLRADVITSCCGSLFSADTQGLSADLSALPPRPALWGFYGSLALAAAAAGHAWLRRRSGPLLALASALAFGAAMAGILSFLSLYVYEHPHHHCPFCILKPEYGHQGYALYIPLFVATAAGLAAGAVQLCGRKASLRDRAPALTGRLAATAGAGFLLFAVVATAMIWRSNLILLG